MHVFFVTVAVRGHFVPWSIINLLVSCKLCDLRLLYYSVYSLIETAIMKSYSTHQNLGLSGESSFALFNSIYNLRGKEIIM